VAEDTDSGRDFMDDTDDSDESSSSKQRVAELDTTIRRQALASFHTRTQSSTETRPGLALPLFYVFCTLLI
jgi:hypothetical protein